MDCVIYGAASAYTSDVIEVLGRLSWKVCGLINNDDKASLPKNLTPLIGHEDIPDTWLEYAVVIPLATPGYRAAAVKQARSAGFTLFPPVVDPTSVVATSATVAEGCIVNAGVVLAANTALGDFASVSRSVSIGHDAVLEEFTFIGPGATLCGGTLLGRGTFVGAGSVVMPEVTIGANAVLGAGAVATGDVPAGAVATGNPAQIVKRDQPGYRGLGV